jgi:hypothetical protein
MLGRLEPDSNFSDEVPEHELKIHIREYVFKEAGEIRKTVAALRASKIGIHREAGSKKPRHLTGGASEFQVSK